MGSCTRRHFLLSTCFLQMITIIERQVFDFLGYMWAPIFVNFFQILFVIFGFYGAYHFRVKYILTYLLWSFLWIGWNAFLICFYMDVGELDKDSDLLNLGTGSVSWFEVNGYGCKPMYPTNITSDDPFRPIRPERVDDCLLEYSLVEVIHSAVQCALAVLGILGAILISYIFLDEDDRFDFMNGDAKSPQHTVVHPMYVSYTSIPTSASATMLSSKHHHHLHDHAPHQQQHSYNNNTFLIHSHSNTPNASKNNTLNSSRKLCYSPKNNKISSSETTIIPTAAAASATISAAMRQLEPQQQQLPQAEQRYYDDSTAKADHQLYTSSQHRQHVLPTTTTTLSPTTSSTSSHAAYQQQQHVISFNNINNTNCNTNTNSSLSYASLQKYSAQNSAEFLSSNSNSNLTTAGSLRSCSAAAGVGVGVGLAVGALSNSNYSLTNSVHNSNSSSNNNKNNNNSSGRFARIHPKPKPPKSLSYSSFINTGPVIIAGNDIPPGPLHLQLQLQQQPRPDRRYPPISNEQLAAHSFGNLEESFEESLDDDDIISVQNFRADAVTYVPFQKPVPGGLYMGSNNNASYASLESNYSGNNNSNNINTTSSATPTSHSAHNRFSPNNNSSIGLGHPLTRDNSQLFLSNNNDLLLERHDPLPQRPFALAIINPASRALLQQSGLSFQLHQQHHCNQRPMRPSNIPLPTVPHHYPHPQYAAHSPLSPSAVTPPPPPAPRPHIFAPRSGHAPYPDLSPEVTEKYSMPTQYVPRSPVPSRIARRQRQQHQQHERERSHLANTSANFCDQIRDAPPGYIDTGFNIVRAKSHDRLCSVGTSRSEHSSPNPQRKSHKSNSKDAAPQVNRRSGRPGGKRRPRSYCNSTSGGEGVIRGGVVLTGRMVAADDAAYS